MRKYCPEPVLVIIDVNPVDDLTIPTEAYRSVENSAQERSENRRTFVHISSSVGAFEAEEVGVEQLLRDIRVRISWSRFHMISFFVFRIPP
jgi:26S proteasome regulatory subunit N8